jgi:hypothetical protein
LFCETNKTNVALLAFTIVAACATAVCLGSLVYWHRRVRDLALSALLEPFLAFGDHTDVPTPARAAAYVARASAM